MPGNEPLGKGGANQLEPASQASQAPQTTRAAAQAAIGGGGGGSGGQPGDRENQPPGDQSAYSIEIRSDNSTNWNVTASSISGHSYLLKDLRPGSEYRFRVVAHSRSLGLRGVPSAEFKYLIPDNRKKPGGTQRLSAGVVSGILFFIACIVIAVCAVNMCNKRRKKRAEKGT